MEIQNLQTRIEVGVQGAFSGSLRSLTTLEDRIEACKLSLPESHRPYTDKYFLNSNMILKSEGLNPWVRAQVFVRKGPGNVYGIEEAIAIIDKFSQIREHGGRIYALKEGANYDQKETVMVIEAPIQDLIELETIYLGVLSAGTTRANEGVDGVDCDQVRVNTQLVRNAIGERPLIYMGARHASFREDAAISAAAFEGGATRCSTDIGAEAVGQVGAGTIPHALENIYAYFVGKDRAVLESLLAYDRVMPDNLPRTALCDYNNREIDDSLAVAEALYAKHGANLSVRVDTCGENVMQGAFSSLDEVPEDHIIRRVIGQVPEDERRFWFGTGVTVSGVLALRTALDDHGYTSLKILLSSGFAKVEKTKAFVRACELLQVNLMDALGAGELWSPSRPFTMDIVAVAETQGELDSHPLSKVGRVYRPNKRLEPVMMDGEIRESSAGTGFIL